MKVKGVDELIKKLRKMDETIQQETKEIIGDTAREIANQAVTNQTHAAGQRFTVGEEVFNKGYSARIFVSGGGPGTAKAPSYGNLAAYREFGTGLSAKEYVPTLPKEWQDLAMSFYVNGKGTLVKRPFLYPAYQKNIPELERDLKELLNRAVK